MKRANKGNKLIISNKNDIVKQFGDNFRSNKSDDAVPVTLFIHKPINFCFRILLDPKIGLGEAYMFEDWDVQSRIQDFLTLLIRAKRWFPHLSFTSLYGQLAFLFYWINQQMKRKYKI